MGYKIELTRDQYFALATARFGFQDDWKFVCPCCGHVAAVREYIAIDEEGAIGFNCIGRYLSQSYIESLPGGGPCNYSGGGLFNFNPIYLKEGGRYFDLAPGDGTGDLYQERMVSMNILIDVISDNLPTFRGKVFSFDGSDLLFDNKIYVIPIAGYTQDESNFITTAGYYIDLEDRAIEAAFSPFPNAVFSVVDCFGDDLGKFKHMAEWLGIVLEVSNVQ